MIGGESEAHEQAHREGEAYDFARGGWRTLPPMPAGRHGTRAASIDEAIHVVAGSANRGGGPRLDDHRVLESRQRRVVAHNVRANSSLLDALRRP